MPVDPTREGGGVLRAPPLLLLTIAGGVLATVLARIHRDWIGADPVPSWDEALHLLAGQLLAVDLRHGDLWAFFYDAYRSTWPPLHAAMLALVFLPAGPSMVAGRLLSWFSFVGLAGATGILAHRLAPKPNGVAPAVAVVLLATCTPLAPFAGRAMLECLGLLLFSTTLVAHDVCARRQASPPTQAALAVASIATFLVRLNFGLLIVMALAVEAAASVFVNGWRATWQSRRIVAGLWMCFVVVWFAHPIKLSSTWQTLVNFPLSPPAGAPEGFLFAPWAMVETVGWPVVLGLLLTLLYWRAWRASPSMRFLVLVTACQLLLVAFHQTKVVRYSFPVVPPTVILCGWLAARWAAKAADRYRGPAPDGIVVALVLLLAGYRVASSLDRLEPPRTAVSISDWRRIGAAVARLANGTKFLLVGDSGLAAVTPGGLDWQLAGELGVLDPSRAGALGEIGRGDAALGLLRQLDRRGLALPGAERAVLRSVASDRSRSLYVEAPPLASNDGTVAEIESLLVKLDIDRFGTAILVTNPVQPRSLTTLLTRRGFAPTGRIDAAGVRVERFDRRP